MRRASTTGVAAALALLLSSSAFAQNSKTPASSTPLQKSTEFSAGLIVVMGRGLGTTNVTETQPNGSPFTLFTMTNGLKMSFGIEALLAKRVTSRVWIEGEGAWRFPTFESKLASDAEGAAITTATQRMWEFSATGAALFVVAERPHRQVFLRGGGGWLRQLSDDHTSYVGGWLATFGGGVKYWWHDRGKATPIGLRIDARIDARAGGFLNPTRAVHLSPAFTSMLTMRF